MMDPHRGKHFAVVPKAFHSALFSVANRFRCGEQCYCDGLILFGCVAVAERAIVALYPESSLDTDSRRKRSLQLEGSTAENITSLPERHKRDSLQ